MGKVISGISCKLALAGLLLLAMPTAQATSKLVITGNIKAAPCEIDGANGSISVNLGMTFPPPSWRPPGPPALGWSSL